MRKDRCYIHWYRAHRPDEMRILRLGNPSFMKWDCVRWHLEEKIGLHSGKKQTAVVMGRYIDGDDLEWFGDDKVVEGQRRVLVKVVPYWYQFDYDPRNHRSAPLCGPVYHPPAIRAFYAAQGVHLPSSFS